MPMLPAHLGPGLLIKAAAPRRFSFTAFALTQLAIDVESVWAWASNEMAHPVLHTFLGGTLAGLVVGVATSVLGSRRRRGAETDWWPALVGGVVGAVLHVLLDALVRDGREPFAPFAAGDPLHNLATLPAVNLWCYTAGAVGLGLLLLRRARRPAPVPAVET